MRARLLLSPLGVRALLLRLRARLLERLHLPRGRAFARPLEPQALKRGRQLGLLGGERGFARGQVVLERGALGVRARLFLARARPRLRGFRLEGVEDRDARHRGESRRRRLVVGDAFLLGKRLAVRLERRARLRFARLQRLRLALELEARRLERAAFLLQLQPRAGEIELAFFLRRLERLALVRRHRVALGDRRADGGELGVAPLGNLRQLGARRLERGGGFLGGVPRLGQRRRARRRRRVVLRFHRSRLASRLRDARGERLQLRVRLSLLRRRRLERRALRLGGFRQRRLVGGDALGSALGVLLRLGFAFSRRALGGGDLVAERLERRAGGFSVVLGFLHLRLQDLHGRRERRLSRLDRRAFLGGGDFARFLLGFDFGFLLGELDRHRHQCRRRARALRGALVAQATELGLHDIDLRARRAQRLASNRFVRGDHVPGVGEFALRLFELEAQAAHLRLVLHRRRLALELQSLSLGARHDGFLAHLGSL